MKKESLIKKGIFYLDGKPRFLLSADYPYYRDRADNWQDRLVKLKEIGIDIITAYIPWRHHAFKNSRGKITYDFDGMTQDNKNLHRFIEITQKIGAYIILKPGPFIHAELNFGGLPDWVSPDEDKTIQPLLDFYQKSISWDGKSLPSPQDKRFSRLVLEWFGEVDKKIFSKIAYPKGNLVGIQIANEGIYSDAAVDMLTSDYSKLAEELYKKFLRLKYHHLKNAILPFDASVSKTKEEIINLMAFADFQDFYYRTVLLNWKKTIRTRVPLMVNISPPAAGNIDIWLSRNVPEELEKLNIAYGYTDWIGIPQEDGDVQTRYLLSIRRAIGFNLEDNWGFSKIYDRRYEHPEVPLCQSLFAVACGAKGFNVYTGVSTTHWDMGLDNKHAIPYPATSPITEKGEKTYKCYLLKLVCSFFKDNQRDFLESRLYAPLRLGFYLPYANICSWFRNKEDFRKAGLREIKCGSALAEFAKRLYEHNLDFDILNLGFCDEKALASKKIIVLPSGFFMDKKTQRKIAAYVKAGGVLVVSGELPTTDEHFNDCHMLKECFEKPGRGKIILPDETKDFDAMLEREYSSIFRIKTGEKQLRIFLYEHISRNCQFVFVFNEVGEKRFVEFEMNNHKIGLNMTAKGVSLIKIEDDFPKAVLVNAKSELYKCEIIPRLIFDKEEIFTSSVCEDIYWYKK